VIGFLGMSHLGLVSAAGAAAKGFDVLGFDEDAGRVDRLRAGELPVVEPGLPELLAEVAERLTFSADAERLAECDLLYVAVDVPTAPDDTSDPAPVEHLLALAAGVAAPGACVVVLSQVEPGFTRGFRALVERGGRTLYYQVETLIFGRAVQRTLEPERFIVGCADPAAPLATALRAHLDAYGCPLLPMRYESAELSKIAINAFLVSTISTTNTLAELCESIGAHWDEIAPALRLDARIGPAAYLTPGLGIGGSNLSRDLATIDRLARGHGTDAGLVGTWRAHAAHRVDWPLGVLHARLLSRVSTPRVALWGLSYKENTQSTRNSPGVRLAEILTQSGIDVTAYDPEAEPVSILAAPLRRVTDPLAACIEADALVIATPWPAFRDADPAAVAAALRGRLVVDPYGVLDADGCRAAGLSQARLGAPLPETQLC
jgi:UDPglucose 6-dehydrogenase